jgi:hypothetical protein
MSTATTQALAATVTVVPCLKGGENGFEDPEEWKDIMEDHSVADMRIDRNLYARLGAAVRTWRKLRWKEGCTWWYWTRTG